MTHYIVGIDYGHGETAAWVVPLRANNPAGLPMEGTSLRLRASNEVEDQKLPSVVYYDNNGNYFLTARPGCGISGGMKGRVSSLDNRRRSHYKNYIKLIVETLLDLNSDILKIQDGVANFRLCMASPTRWNDDEKKEYLELFNEALTPLNLRFEWIINESDAAYFTFNDKTAGLDKCSLVIDYGSSTIDYTAMRNGRKISNDDWSNQQLGASNIENTMFESLSPQPDGSGCDDLLAITRSLLRSKGLLHIAPQQFLVFNLRMQKESDYTQGLTDFELIYRFTKPTADTAFSRPLYEFIGNYDKVTADYRNLVREDLIGLRQNIKNVNGGKDPDSIVLSGGASIMRWFKDLVKEVFDCNEYLEDRNPSFVVAKGIALYARAQEIALDRFMDCILSIDYGQIYKEADIWATSEGVKRFVDRPVRKISSSPITGIKIREIFCEFIQGLNSHNNEYCDLVQRAVDESLSKRVSNELVRAIQEVFHVHLSINDISIHIPVIILDWNATNFNPGGAWYNNFTGAIEKISSRYNFTWEKTRDTNETSQIANGVKNFLLGFDYDNLITYNSNFLNSHGDEIKQQAKRLAIDLFFDYQLFKTTFAETN